MSGGGPSKQEVSQQEIDQAKFASERWNERVDDGYLELERSAAKDASTDHSGVISGRASADLAKMEKQGLRQAMAGGASNRDVTSLGNTVAEARSAQDVDTAQQAQALADQRTMGMVGVGQDTALSADSGLRQAAQLGGARAQNKLENKLLTDNAKFSAVMDAAGGAASGAALRADGFRLTKAGMEQTHNPGLRGAKPLAQTMTPADYSDHRKKESSTLGWTSLMGGI